MLELMLKRGQSPNGLPYLYPPDSMGFEAMQQIPYGDEVRVSITRPRNAKHHNKFFLMLQLVYENQDMYATLNGLLHGLKMAIGHCDKCTDFSGNTFYAPRSINWASMDQVEFEQFYNKAVRAILTHVIPNAKKKDLETEVYQILGERGPNDT